MVRIRTLVVNHLWWIVLLIALGLLICHTLGLRPIVVDNTSLVLVAVILVSPFVAAIKKIKVGEFEAEIAPEEVRRVTQEAAKSLPESPSEVAGAAETDTTTAALKRLAETDPVIALAKLRVELESRLRRVAKRVNPETAEAAPATLSSIIRTLTTAEVVGRDFAKALRDVVAICNRAIHGEDIRDVDARQIVDTGSELLDALEQIVREYGTVDSVESAIVTARDVDDYYKGRYRVTTIVPLVHNPERRVYVLTQQELDSFLDGYSEYAEFIVALERIS